MGENKTCTIIIRVSLEFKRQFLEYCKEHRRTPSNMARIIIEDCIKNRTKV